MVFAEGERILIAAQRHLNYSFFILSLFIDERNPSVTALA